MAETNPSDIITGGVLVETLIRHARPKPDELLVLSGGSSRGLAKIVKLAESSDVPVRWVGQSEMKKLTADDLRVYVDATQVSGNKTVKLPIRAILPDGITLVRAAPKKAAVKVSEK